LTGKYEVCYNDGQGSNMTRARIKPEIKTYNKQNFFNLEIVPSINPGSNGQSIGEILYSVFLFYKQLITRELNGSPSDQALEKEVYS
jgi:hypothetical protein